jgi:uncharacterized membrane protein
VEWIESLIVEKGDKEMEKMLVIVVDSETKAYEASRALKELDQEGSIWIYGKAIIQKNTDGAVTMKGLDPEFPVGTVAGTAIGAVIGLLGGPLGVGIGAATGTMAGGFRDLYVAGVSAEFVDDAAATLKPGKFAVIADIGEDWVTPVDVRIEALGGTVFRSPVETVEAEQRTREMARLRAEIEQTEAELAQAHADRKAKLQAKIDKLNAQLRAQLDQANQRQEQIKRETEAKVQALQGRVEKARGEVKAGLNAELKRIREGYEETNTKLRHLLAEHLRSAAAKLEKEQPQLVHH